MKKIIEKLEALLELGGTRKDIILLAVSGAALACSLLRFRPFSFDMAWIAAVLCALVHNTGSVLVITNSALLLNWRRKE